MAMFTVLLRLQWGKKKPVQEVINIMFSKNENEKHSRLDQAHDR